MLVENFIQTIKQQFVDWTKKKIRHHFDCRKKEVYFREKEIWWVALGKNMGMEMDGKHELFERPALIIKKYSSEMCFVLPLTTQIKNPRPWYQIVVDVEGENNAVNITQGRTISRKRLLRKKAVMNRDDYRKVFENFTDQFYIK